MKPPLLSALVLSLLLNSPLLHAAPKGKPAKSAVPEKVAVASGAQGWLDWRGPQQTGASLETGLPDKVDAKAALWTADFPGQSAPVIANGKLYIMGYLGEGPDLQEGVACFDAETGKPLWKQLFNDFLSDIIYLRYATSCPTIDPETGNVYTQGSQGLFSCFTADGKLVWQHSLMEEFGRLTFPNNRTASPLIDKELVITRGITSSWGAHGAAGDRFYAFDKKTGELVWSSAPGDRPQDNTFCHPWLGFHEGRRVLYSAGGDSTLLAINARTGEPLWRTSVAKAGAKGGINAAVLEHKGNIIVTHESENLDTSDVGRMAAFKIPDGVKPPTPQTPQVIPTKELEQWRNPVGALASSPVLVGDRIYAVNGTGDLCAIDANDGKVLWKKKLGIEQRQSSPFYADGKLYVAMYIAGATGPAANENVGDGELFVVKPGDKDAEIVSRTVLTGKCYGSPIGYNGKLYVQTEKKLYCFGKKGANKGLVPAPEPEKWPAPGPATQLQIIPYEVLLQPGQKQQFRIRSLDAAGFTAVGPPFSDRPTTKWETFIPPTALVKATMKASFSEGDVLTAEAPSAGQWKATVGELSGFIKGRVVSSLPIKQDFETFELKETTGPGLGKEPIALPPAEPGKLAPAAGPTTWNVIEEPTAFAYPPLWWNSARFRFEVRKPPHESDNLAFCKTIDNKLFQRGQVFIGAPDMHDYTIEADVMSEGNKRKMSEVGVINQRYAIVLKGNAQLLEISSNQELYQGQPNTVPFKWVPGEWYHIKARVDNNDKIHEFTTNPDRAYRPGSGVIRAKVWKKSDPEPAAWTLELPVKRVHLHGSPGLFGFSPQEQRAWFDNVTVTPNK
ncbi:MAG: PQQ-binding-like beta-propeller repeat protein [Chthoniobacter sp.]|nr:PQQ-binding-like beta-propeller repeat protein [Chthoniobacter sp.]